MSLLARIAKIERSNFRLKMALTIGSVLIGALVVMGAAQKPPTKLRTEKLELVDNQGTVRAVLQVKDESGVNYVELCIFDSSGEVRRLSLIATETEGFVEVTKLKIKTENSRCVEVD